MLFKYFRFLFARDGRRFVPYVTFLAFIALCLFLIFPILVLGPLLFLPTLLCLMLARDRGLVLTRVLFLFNLSGIANIWNFHANQESALLEINFYLANLELLFLPYGFALFGAFLFGFMVVVTELWLYVSEGRHLRALEKERKKMRQAWSPDLAQDAAPSPPAASLEKRDPKPPAARRP